MSNVGIVIFQDDEEGGGDAYTSISSKYDGWRLDTVLPLDDSGLVDEFCQNERPTIGSSLDAAS